VSGPRFFIELHIDSASNDDPASPLPSATLMAIDISFLSIQSQAHPRCNYL
jgi:hypothetical protein